MCSVVPRWAKLSAAYTAKLQKLAYWALRWSWFSFFRKIQAHKVNPFVKYFIILSLSLFFLSWIFFTTNLGWRDWHTAFLSPLIFLGFLLVLTEIPTLLGAILLAVSIYSHLNIFISRYQQNFRPTGDPSLLVNEIAAIDWVYQKALQPASLSTLICLQFLITRINIFLVARLV